MKLQVPVEQKVRIEILPLIDIVFLLLVFFIYAMLSMAVHRGLPVDLPTSSTAKIDKSDRLSVTVRAGGGIFIDKERVSLDELDRILAEHSADPAKPGVLLFGDRDVSYQRLFRVLDRIQKAGISKVSLQAEMQPDTP
jgi:biopolymer transport protein ExbD